VLGIIGGTSLLYAKLPPLEKERCATPYGPAEIYRGEDVALLLRHQGNRPPHRINYQASLAALVLAGADRIVSIGSVGSLQLTIQPGSIVLPDDYLSYTSIPTIYDNSIGHVAPSVDADLVSEIAGLIPDAHLGGTYVQAPGPRFETSAEIRMMQQSGDVLGMTVASEATLANEFEIPFAAVCFVDNFCNGLSNDKVSYEGILATVKANKTAVELVVGTIVAELS